MIINSIDELFDSILNKFYDFLYKKDIFTKFKKDSNFVVFQEEILLLIHTFVKTISKDDIIKLIKKENYLIDIINIIKRYCAYYIYLGIAYYYKDGRDLFITNIIESSKNQKDTIYKLENFFNSENNSKIINFYLDIKNIISLAEFKTMDKIKIIISNNPIKFERVLKLFNNLGEDFVENNFLIKDNFENIIKTIIFREIYLIEEKKMINDILNEIDKEKGEYKYIEIIISNSKKLVDFNIIQKFLTINQLRSGLAEEIYNYLEENQEIKEIIINENQDFINYLFSNKIIIPITEEFLRFHKDSEKYDSDIENKKDDTKVKYIITKMNNIRNYYSPIIQKNYKLKLEISKYFYKNLDPRMAVLYNDNEEIKIIQKLSSSNNPLDFDLLIELQNLRKYSYVNFKNSSRDYIKLRPGKSIDAIRLINLEKKKGAIETRIGNSNIDLNIVGVVFNPYRLNIKKTKKNLPPLDCYNASDLINVTKLTKNDNGFLSFLKVIESTVNKKTNKLYYWLFNNEKDIPQLNKYIDYNKNEPEQNFNIMIAEIYELWIKIVKDKFNKYLDSIKEINNIELEHLVNVYEKKYFNLNFNPELKNFLLNKALTQKFLETEVIEDTTDNIIPGKRDKIISLPYVNIIKQNKSIITIKKTKKIVEEDINNNAICHHHIKWANLNKRSKTEKQDLNQNVFEFVKKYVRENEKGDYVCKSCNEILSIQKYVYEGTYIKELDQFMTTSLVVNENLYNIPKYTNLKRTIVKLEQIIEKIAHMAELSYYIGNDITTQLHRKLVIKDTIDLILLHTDYLRKQPKNRIELAVGKYNISKDLTNLFFFELKDDIFKTSSTDTDYYKLIKYNNVIAYLLLIIITELNPGQILNFKNDKRCNYFFFSKVSDTIFKNLYLRLNDKEKILISKIPLLTYIIYYLTCILTNNRVWLWVDNEEIKKDSFNINIQKTIINTLIDLINSIIEANLEKDKNYLYEILVARFSGKIHHTFNDDQILKRIDLEVNKKIIYDEKTKKLSFLSKKINYISITNSEVFETTSTIVKDCNLKVKRINRVKFKSDNNNISYLTNCDDGNFHQWIFIDDTMICKLCKKKYFDLLSNDTETVEESNAEYFEKLRFIFIKKLTKKYCLSGDFHQISPDNGICNICKINPDTYKYSNKELSKLEEKLNSNENNIIQEKYTILTSTETNIKEKYNLDKKIINKLEKRFEHYVIKKYNSNQLENYIIDFVDRLISILGKKIKIKNKTTYLKDTVYILDHNYLGNTTKNIITILSGDNLILTYLNHPFFNKDIIYYKDKGNKMYVYYDIVTLQYLGYSENNKVIKQNNNNASLKIEYSIKDCLMLLGLENTYTNLYHIDSTLVNNFNPDITRLINDILRNRIINLKQIITRTISIINLIRNNGKINSLYNIKEKEIVNEFVTKLRQFNLKNKDNTNGIFKNFKHINSLINLKPLKGANNFPLNKNYFNNDILNKTINADSKIIFYLIMNFNRLLDYNTQPAIESELAYLIIRIIQYNSELYLRENNYLNIRKYDYIILCDSPYIDETVRINDNQDIVKEGDTINEDKIKEENYDAQEEFDAFDIDDYEKNDDIDGTMEAFDGDI
jgi:hypothetical protein